MRIFVLAKQYPDLAESEVIYGLGLKNLTATKNCIMSNSKSSYKHLAYTNFVLDNVFELKAKSILVRNYAVRKVGTSRYSEKEIADILNISGKVKLKNPDTYIGYLNIGRKTYVGDLWINPKGFEKRKPHKRPVLHPSSLHPRLARACVNMLGTGGTILDPFCGTGGILIEAGLTGHKIIGYDLSNKMLEGARINLQQFGLRAKLEKRDALSMPRKYKVVTDLPYGKNTASIDKNLYTDFIKLIKKNKKPAVLMLPEGKYNIEYRKKFKIYLHKSLSKRIYLI